MHVEQDGELQVSPDGSISLRNLQETRGFGFPVDLISINARQLTLTYCLTCSDISKNVCVYFMGQC